MAYVANKIRFFFIWEQDNTFQTYIKRVWGKYNIQTIISDQFIALFYKWKKYIPAEQQKFLVGAWMNENIRNNHGPLCSLYKSLDNGDFRSEGDSPSFMHAIPTGLRNLENPGWGGWAGRYTNVRDNTWLDPVAEPGYVYPEGRWYTNTAWGRVRLRKGIPNDTMLIAYLKPIWRWMEAFQNDFAARADWCVKSYENANHPPVVVLANELNLKVKPGDTVNLSALGTSDPDGDDLKYRWWQYREAGTYNGSVEIMNSDKLDALFTVPENFQKGESIHIICEVTDTGTPPLSSYQRVVVETDTVLTSVRSIKQTVLNDFALAQNYPNPFNPSTKIDFSSPKRSHVKLEVFDITGRRVATLIDEVKGAGNHSINFNGSNLSTGIYIYKLTTANNMLVRKMLLTK